MVDVQDLIAKGIRVVILAALFYYIIIDVADHPKDLSLPLEKASQISADVLNIHDEKGNLVELGYETVPRLVFDRNRVYPVILGMNMFKQFKLKEFDHFAFQFDRFMVQMAYV